MRYNEIAPTEQLRAYVKCFFIIETDEVIAYEAVVLPSGYPELIFNLSDIYLHSATEDRYNLTPPVDYLGQLTKPFQIKSKGRHCMLGIRFYAHAPSYFLRESMDEFNNQVSDLTGLLNKSTRIVYERLMEAQSLKEKINLLEAFLIERLSKSDKEFTQIELIGHVTQSLAKNGYNDNIDYVANRFGISNRYLQKLFVQYIGLTPKSFLRVNRFRNSLGYLDDKSLSLTEIAYSCGYFDQSHFIKEFKSFSGGKTPTAYIETKTAE